MQYLCDIINTYYLNSLIFVFNSKPSNKTNYNNTRNLLFQDFNIVT